MVAGRAKVNLGMFHYHFGTKDAFVRRLLQGIYDEMFAHLEVAADNPDRPVEALRSAVSVVARFVRDQRTVVRRILADALDGHAVAREFLQRNVPRHLRVIVALVAQAQRARAIRSLPLTQAVAFIAGAVGAPVLVVGALLDDGIVDPGFAAAIDAEVLSDEAIAQRVDLALAALGAPPRGRR
jgi:AcrR family transcriptional regulator